MNYLSTATACVGFGLILFFASCQKALDPSPVRDRIPPSQVMDLTPVDSSNSTVTLTWTAPSDDGGREKVTEYQVRYAIREITEMNWDSTPSAISVPKPGNPGQKEVMTVHSLSMATQYYFAVRSMDDGGNWSEISDLARTQTDRPSLTADLPPDAVTDLTITAYDAESVTLMWSAPNVPAGEESLISDIRYSRTPLFEGSWPWATRVIGPVPQPPGTQEIFTVKNLLQGSDYYFGIMTRKEASDAWSPLSNVVKTRTLDKAGKVTLVGQYNTPGYAADVAIKSGYAYVADYYGGLQIINVSDPATPFLASNYSTPSAARAVELDSNYAYVLASDPHRWSGLIIVDVTIPSCPCTIAKYDSLNIATGLAVWQNYVIIADYTSGLKILDVSTPANPSTAGRLKEGDIAQNIVIVGNYAYLADYSGGLGIIDIAYPGSVYRISTYSTGGYARDVKVARGLAFVANDYAGLRIINVTDPVLPHTISNYETPGQALGIALEDRFAFVADGYGGGLQVIHVGDPTRLYSVGSYQTPDAAHSVAVVNNFVYVAAGAAGLLILKFEP